MATSSLIAARRVLEARMTDECVITETTATPVDDAVDPDTLKPVPVAGETPQPVYDGPCFWTSTFGGEDLVSPGGASAELGDAWLFLPSTAPVPAVGARVTITDSVDDPSLVDQVSTVVSEDLSGLNIARAVRCQTLTAGRPLHGT